MPLANSDGATSTIQYHTAESARRWLNEAVHQIDLLISAGKPRMMVVYFDGRNELQFRQCEPPSRTVVK